MSAETKIYEQKMEGVLTHLSKELGTIRAGRANPAILDKVSVDYYGTPTPINQIAAV
ncbi:MAG: ribosome recycling factor, partial [Ruthenibacterium sp.]